MGAQQSWIDAKYQCSLPTSRDQATGLGWTARFVARLVFHVKENVANEHCSQSVCPGSGKVKWWHRVADILQCCHKVDEYVVLPERDTEWAEGI